MSSLRLMGKWGVPVATAVAVPIFGPSVFADSGSKDSAKTMTGTSRMIRPSELPIYEEPEEVLDFEYHGRERTSLEETVGAVREEVEGVFEATRAARERVVHICETGKAHTMASVDLLKELQIPEVTVDYITDEENMLPRVGAITIGGLAGLVLGARKKGGLVKKAFYTSAGVTATASMCYPRQAYQISQQAYGTTKEYANIGYNFVAGVKPQSKVAAPEEPIKEPPVEPVPVPEASPSTETPSAETASTESEGGEVRSVLPQAIPDEKFPAPVDSLVQQSSDVMQWGFRLTDKESNAPSIMPADVVPPTESLVPEGFGAVREADDKDIVESASEPVTVPKESCSQTEETEVPDTIGEVVEKIVEDIAEKVGEDIVEDVAAVVKEIAEETLESMEEVAKTADLIENITERVSSTIDVIQEVLESADKAAEESGLPDTLIDVSEAVVEGVERIVDTVNVIAGKVEEVADAVVKEVKDLKDDAIELVEDEEKREELVEKVIDYVKDIIPPAETSDSDEIQKPEEAKEPLIEEESKQLIDEKAIEGKESDLKGSEVGNKASLPDPVEVTEPAPCITEPVPEVTEPTVELEKKPVTDESLVETAEPKAEEIVASTETIEPDVQQMSESPDLVKDIEATSSKEDKDQVAVAKKGLFSNLLSLFTKDKEEKVIEKTQDVSEETAESTIDHSEEPTKLEPESTVAPEVLPLVEKLAEDIVEKVGEKVVEEVAEIVEEISKEAEKDAEIIADTAEVVDESGGEAVKVLEAIEVVAEAADEAAKAVPGVPEIVGEISEKIDEIAKESEAVIDTVVAVAEHVEEMAKEIGQEAKIIEAEAATLVESEEKREELVEKVIEFVGEKLSGDLPKEEVLSEVLEAQVESQAVKVDEGIEPSQLVAENVEAVAADVKKEGLFDKLVNLFKDKDAKMEKPEGQMVEDVKELVNDAEQILKPLGDDGEKKPTKEEILKSDEVLDQKPTEEVEEQKPAEAELQNTQEVPVSDTVLEVSVGVESLPQVPVEMTVQEPPILTEPEALAVVKTEDSITETTPETQSKEGGLVGKLIDFFSNDEKASHSEQVSGKEGETSNTELVTEPVGVAEVPVDVTPELPLGPTTEAIVETTPELVEVPVESAPEVPVETASELPVETTPELPEVSVGRESLSETPVETTVQETPIEAEPEVLPLEKTEDPVVETATEIKSKEGGLIGKLIDFFSNDEKASHSEQVSSKDGETSNTELVTEPVGVAEVPVDVTPELPLDTTAEAIVETTPELLVETTPELVEVPVKSTPEVPVETASELPVEIPPEVPEVSVSKESVSEAPVETTVQETPIEAEPEVLPVEKTEDPVVETATETKSKEGGLIGKLIDFLSSDDKTSHSEQVSNKDVETSQSELAIESVGVAEVSVDSTVEVPLDTTPEAVVETKAEVPVEGTPELPLETAPDPPVDIKPEIPVDTASEVPIEKESVLEAPVETTVQETPIEAEPEVLPVEKTEDSIVETATEAKSKEGGLIGKLIDFFANDDKTSHSEQVSGKDEETSQAELITEPVSVAEVSVDSAVEVPLDTTPEAVVETKAEVPVEGTPELPLETAPDPPVDVKPEIPVDTASEVPIEKESVSEAPVETTVQETPIEAEPEVLPVEKTEHSVVETATEIKSKEGGLIGKLIDFFANDDKTSHSEQVSGKDEETSQAELITEPVSVAEVSVGSTSEITVDTIPEVNVETTAEVPVEITLETPVETSPVVLVETTAEEPVETEVKEVKGGLVDKLVNLFSSDKASHTSAESETHHPVKEEQPVIISETVESASEIVDTEEKSAVPEETITKGLEEGPSVEAEEPVPLIVSDESKKDVDSGLVGKLASLFSKKEENLKVADIEIVETPVKVSDDKVADELDFVMVEHSDVSEDKDIVADLSNVTTEIVDKSSDIAESKDIVVSDDSGKSEGLFDKLRTFMSKSEAKEDPKLSDVDEALVSDGKQEVEPEVAELPSDVKIEAKEIITKTDTDEASSVSVEGSGGLFSSFGTFFTKEKSEVVESVDDSSPSGELDSKDVEESTQSEAVISEPETPTLEVKDKSLFDKIAELISTNDDNSEGTSDEALGSITQESQTEATQEELPQQVPEVDADQQKPLLESSDAETKPSLLDRVTSLFSKDSEHVPIEKQSAVNEGSTESSSSPDSKTATSDEDAEVFVVLSKPSIPVETPEPEDGQKEAEKATGWLQGSWFRSNASVSEEGKDIIIQVAPETPEKDFGQSNPEDDDMYTTRK